MSISLPTHLLARYRELYRELGGSALGTGTQLVPSGDESIETVVRKGWLGKETPALMRGVLHAAHDRATQCGPEQVDAIGAFVNIIKSAADLINGKNPGTGQAIQVNNTVVLDALREYRV